MRVDGWEQALYDYIEQSKDAVFTWGSTDCALWVATFVDSITGSHLADDWRGLYDTEEGAAALMAERGFANAEAIADAALTPKNIRRAMRGDVVLLHNGALGLCDGRRCHFLTPDHGLVSVLTINCKKAWSV